MRFFWPNFEFGSRFNDELTGTNGRDWIFAFGGNDHIMAGGGNDFVLAGRGNDTIDGGSGDDFISAGRGDDLITTGSGDDYVDGGRGFDTVSYEGSIVDYSIDYGRWGRVTITSEDGTDTLRRVEAVYFAADDYTLFLDGTNNAALAGDDAAVTGENAILSLSIADLLANDQEFDGDTLSITNVGATTTAGSTVTLNAGTIDYDPGAAFDALQVGEKATDTFTYVVDDGKGGTDTATVTITITGENDAPVLSSDVAVTVDENTVLVPANISATDVDSAQISFSLSGDDAALFTIDASTGALSFINAPDFEAPGDADGDNGYAVDVIATDSEGAATSAALTITVEDVEELPIVNARLNELHYDNVGSDLGEFVEIRVDSGDDVSALTVALYNGSNAAVYSSASVGAGTMSSDGTYDYYVLDVGNFPGTSGIQNGSPDGVALANGPNVIEFLSYEGTLTAADGVAAGITSTDIGVAETSGTPAGTAIWRNDDGTWTAEQPETPGAANVAPLPKIVINEIMQNPSAVSDNNGEWFELYNAGSSDIDISGWTVFDDGSDSFTINTDGPLIVAAGGYVVLGNNADAATNGGVAVDYEYSGMFLSNGADELVLSDTESREVDRVEWDGGPNFPDPNGASMALIDPNLDNNDASNWQEGGAAYGDGDLGSPGAVNVEPVSFAGRINEFHYDNASGDVDELIEVRVDKDADVSAAEVTLYNGNGGASYQTLALADGTKTSDDMYDYYVLEPSSIQNGGPDGLALSNGGTLVEFLSYEGTFTASNGPAAGVTSTDIGVAETGSTPIGQSLQRNEDGTWNAPAEATTGVANDDAGGGGGGGGEEPDLVSIGSVQGTGFASPLDGMDVKISGVVTYTVDTGFFVQDAGDGDALSSDGIFVFLGNMPNLPNVGDVVSVVGTVDEFFGATQITGSPTVTIESSGNPLPSPTDIFLGPNATAADFEKTEGMYVALQSATDDPITVVTNFNLDRFGSIEVAAGVKYQPTQRIDPDDQAAIDAAVQANTNNTLVIDDGKSGQNPTEFQFIANNTAGDNGNGYLDAGDTFTPDGATLRLGSELDAPATGVLTYAFGDYTMFVDGTLSIDPTTNEGARQATPDDVGGDIQLGAFNVLNYFTTLRGEGTSGPNELSPRGAGSAEDLIRQQDKIVSAMEASGVDVFALQEIENGGFGEGSAIQTLVDAMNASSLDNFQVVNPTTDGVGFIGTDAITTGIVYDADKVTLVDSAAIVFDEASAAVTFDLAEQLASAANVTNSVGDFQRNRPATIATFEDAASGQEFTVVSVHFKSKGPSGLDTLIERVESALSSTPDPFSAEDRAVVEGLLADFRADPNVDQGDGQGFWNQVRTDASGEVYDFLTTEYGDGGVSNSVILGDFNSYSQEDPTQEIAAQADTTDLLAEFVGEDAYSFVFDGQRGALDQVIASNDLAANVTGLTEWHINADEPDLLNYNSAFNNAGFYSDGPFAASDHDPVIVGLQFDPLVVG